jgi:hypothetical protein
MSATVGRERQDDRLLRSERGGGGHTGSSGGLAKTAGVFARLRELAELNKERNLRRAREADSR